MTLADAEVELFDCEHKTPNAADEGIPYISIPQMKDGRLDASGARLVAAEDLPEWNRRVTPREGDLIVSRRTNPGVSAVVPRDFPCVLGQNLVILRSRETFIDQRFLRWLAQGPDWWAANATYLNVGAVFDSLRCSDIPSFEVPVPPLPEQRAIAHILGSLDDKIELNRGMSETLEAMARALFKSWFVDFDPVRAKAEGRDPGLPAELAELFPDRLVDSELGEIPEGWRIGSLGEISMHPRRAVRPEGMAPDLPYVALEHMPKGRITLFDWGVAAGIGSSKHAFRRGEILFGKLRPYFHKVGIAPIDGVCSTDIVVIAAKESAWNGYVLACVSSSPFVEFTAATATGTRMPRTSWRDMAAYQLALPPATLAARYGKIARPALDRLMFLIAESRTLTALRDTLLPRLVSGELRVPADKLDLPTT